MFSSFATRLTHIHGIRLLLQNLLMQPQQHHSRFQVRGNGPGIPLNLPSCFRQHSPDVRVHATVGSGLDADAQWRVGGGVRGSEVWTGTGGGRCEVEQLAGGVEVVVGPNVDDVEGRFVSLRARGKGREGGSLAS